MKCRRGRRSGFALTGTKPGPIGGRAVWAVDVDADVAGECCSHVIASASDPAGRSVEAIIPRFRHSKDFPPV